ncbi:glycosyltransferase [Modestobacter sp. VKM Ac-2981]|uniref:glycosyltransferase n=1 Tax=Modestobacter sp. VKM Ac-2981 TaxID=3004135 RepID=UPI0022AAEDAE|nr:glycosyltransferase [Modestobacter sp. VKM Ac-2981]MCZ2825587.1 glycosyltransferase [Modestobacter sp. VKM Ac-2981]
MPRELPELRPGAERRLVLAASTGGHLAQLVRLAPGLGASADSLWITFDTAQSQSLLAGRNVLHVPYIRPREGLKIARAFRSILPRLRSEEFDAAVSTGSALALAALPAAHLAGIPTLYIESVSRVNGPSVSGRVLAAMRFAQLRTQHPAWAGGRWGTHPSVFSAYRTVPRADRPEGPPRLFITLGTLRGYPFHSIIDRVLEFGLADENTVWQLGETEPATELPGQVHREVSGADFDRYAREADVVITHAGVGSVLGLLEMGISPIAVVRRRARGEHVGDHQQQLASLMKSSGIGVAVEVDELCPEVVAAAARVRVEVDPSGPGETGTSLSGTDLP